MLRRTGSGRLSQPEEFRQEAINPMDGVANLADVMLVFACGIMLALIINWNVDVGGTAGKPVDIDSSQEVTQLEGLADSEDSDLSQSGGYENYGTVYRDKETGALYVVTNGDGSSGTASGSSSGTSGSASGSSSSTPQSGSAGQTSGN